MPRKNFKTNTESSPKERKKIVARKKACRFCVDKDLAIDYKLVKHLTPFLTERGKIVARRMTGNCIYHQKRIVESVKRARHLALLPYTIAHSVTL